MTPETPQLRRELRLWDLVLLNISAVVGVRWLSAAAHSGPGSITLWLLAAVFFFLPSALVVAGLSKRFPEEGGLYIWTKHAFGDWHAFLCAWFYFLANLIFFPALLVAGVAMASFMLGDAGSRFAENRLYTVPIAVAVLWAAFLANLLGLKWGKWAGNLGGASTYSVAALLTCFGAWSFWRHGSATHLNIVPAVNFDSLNFWSQIAFAFAGLELGAILGGEIRQPGKTIPRAAAISGVACATFYIAGTFALLVLMPPAQISALTGLAQAGSVAGARLGATWLSPCFALLISMGVVGQLGSWIAGIGRLPFAIGLDHHLPPVFARLHPRWGTPYAAILTEGVIATLFLLVMQMGETLRAAYQILVDICVVTTFIPFLYIFACGFKFGQRIASACGLIVSLGAIVLSVLPPPEVASVPVFELKVIGGCIALGLLGHLIFARGKARWA